MTQDTIRTQSKYNQDDSFMTLTYSHERKFFIIRITGHEIEYYNDNHRMFYHNPFLATSHNVEIAGMIMEGLQS